MFKYDAGFVGAGNMGGTLAAVACKAVDPKRVIVSCRSKEHAAVVAQRLGCNYGSTKESATSAKFVFLGIKPYAVKDVASDIWAVLDENSVVVSMLAGVTLYDLEDYFGKNRKIIRIMPNTPCCIGKGTILFAANYEVNNQNIGDFKNLMRDAGNIVEVPERLINAGGAITGCGPAFAYVFVEALADGAVTCGLSREDAIRFAAEMLSGSAEMILKSGKHPAQLKDEVCSPGGSTIEGITKLEAKGFRSACIEAVISAYEKTKLL